MCSSPTAIQICLAWSKIHLLTHDSPQCSIFKFIIGHNSRKVFIGSCRGLICFTDRCWAGDGYGIYLFNLFVRKYKVIDLESSRYADLIREMKPDRLRPHKGDVIRIQIGYSEIEDDYKVIGLIIPNNKPKRYIKPEIFKKRATKVEIYSLKICEWKSVDFPTEIEIDIKARDVCVLGSLYWLIKKDTGYLLCFDFNVQVFSKIELPKPYMKLPVSHLLNKNDSLVILLHENLEDSVSGELEMCLLMLEEKNLEGHKWKVCSYKFSTNYIDWEYISLFMPLGFTIGGRLIWTVDHLGGVRDNERDILFAVDLDNKCAIEKFKFNFREHLVNGSGVGFIDEATNVLENLVLFSG